MMNDETPTRLHDRDMVICGWILLLGSGLSVLGMLHHPTAGGHGLVAVQNLARMADLANAVHGFLMVVLGAMVFGLSGLTARLGWSSPAPRAAFIAYAIGAMTMLGAAVINGFAYSRLAGWFLAHKTTDPMLIDAVLAALGSLATTLAQVGVAGQAFAIALWALALWRHNKALAVLGAVVAIPSFAAMFGAFPLNVHFYLGVVVSQAVWTMAVGAAMVRGRV